QKALPLYKKLESQLGVKLDVKLPVYRKFSSLEEQNDWFTASDKPLLSEYLSPKIIKNHNKYIKAPFGFGEVLGTGRIDVKTLVVSYKKYLFDTDRFFEQVFDYEFVKSTSERVLYKNI